MSKRKPRLSVRCSCVCADGSPCGRRVTDGSQPPICHVHRAKATGNLHNGGTLKGPKPVDRLARAREFQRDSDPKIAIRGFEMEDEILAKQANKDDGRWRDFDRHATLAQFDELCGLLAQIRQLLERANTQPLRTDDGVTAEAVSRDNEERRVLFAERMATTRVVVVPEEAEDGEEEDEDEDYDPLAPPEDDEA